MFNTLYIGLSYKLRLDELKKQILDQSPSDAFKQDQKNIANDFKNAIDYLPDRK